MTLTFKQMVEATTKRVSLISKEFMDGFEFVSNYPRSVTFFGSARTKEDDADYEKARRLAGRVVTELRYSVLTGGGPGIMEAANRGAYEASGNSLGLNIDLPKEQSYNQYLTDKISFHYFFSRKVCLSFSAEAFLFFPGGFGTLDEFLEVLTLMQTKKIPTVPIILVGEKHWRPIEECFKKVILEKQMINPEDLSLYTITDDEEEIMKIIKEAPVRIGLEYNKDSERPYHNNRSNNPGPLSSFFKKLF